MDALCTKAELVLEKHSVALAKVHGERHGEAKALKTTTLRSEATLAKVHDQTSSEFKKLHSERDSAAVRHFELLASTRRVVKAREERKDRAIDALVKQRKIYDSSGMFTMGAHVAEWGDPR